MAKHESCLDQAKECRGNQSGGEDRDGDRESFALHGRLCRVHESEHGRLTLLLNLRHLGLSHEERVELALNADITLEALTSKLQLGRVPDPRVRGSEGGQPVLRGGETRLRLV